jgi:transposase
MIPTSLAPSSVQQKSHDRLLSKYFYKRKAWLFSYDASSAQASANLFSLVTTCRVNDVEPYAYLNYLFEHLPAATTVEQVEALLPWNLKAMLDAQHKKSQPSQSSAA